MAERFRAFAHGEFDKVVAMWEHAYARIAKPKRRKRRGEDEEAVAVIQAALGHMAIGQLSEARRILLSKGLGDLTDERVVAQLRVKHRVREVPMPGVLDDGGVPFRARQVGAKPAYDHDAAPLPRWDVL